jgi:PBP1b-binding outer membrane lipoprotein LpoB
MDMSILRITTPLLVALLASGCNSVPKEKTEYEKQIDAMPMPTTEADRLEQCKKLNDAVFWQMLENGMQSRRTSFFKPPDYSKVFALNRRMVAMKCPKVEIQPCMRLQRAQ